MDVAIAIDAEAVTVAYRAVGAGAGYDASTGKANAAVVAPVNIKAAIQPASGAVLMQVPEGLRSEVQYTAWSRTVVALNGQIDYGGRAFKIIYLWPRPMDGFNRFALGMLP